ncbi:hypothetical protein FJT64_006574 [Amphibalanus amphitrite]|uniref:Uncharacterized protein n=1 Tax=Amphibalanus amphitrite TaxID=1232801 RepID=A0A6A4VSP0_AMPAM|nr:hypothetical protein FJT64_006574 [Amphibalanus amphitrite]
MMLIKVDGGGCAALAQLSRRPPEPIPQSGISAAAHSPVTASEASRDSPHGHLVYGRPEPVEFSTAGSPSAVWWVAVCHPVAVCLRCRLCCSVKRTHGFSDSIILVVVATTPIFRTEEPLWFLETAWCSQTQMGLSESTVWDLQSLMGARQM